MFIVGVACNKNGTSVVVNKTKDRYELVAEYPKRKTEHLEKYLKSVLGKDNHLLADEQINTGKEIRLNNVIVFYLRYNPGKLEMEMLLEKNNTEGYRYFDQVAAGVKRALL